MERKSMISCFKKSKILNNFKEIKEYYGMKVNGVQNKDIE